MRKPVMMIVMIPMIMVWSGLAVWATGATEDAPAAETAEAPTGKYSEAPMLARLVAQGKLPPVEERLPDVPVVAGPGVLHGTEYLDWTPGKYSDGRTLESTAMFLDFTVMAIATNNILWAPDHSTKDMIPVLVEEFSTSDDYTVFNFTIRKGLKWSNGDLATTEDVRFNFEDLFQYPEAEIAYPRNLHAQGDRRYPVVELEIKDEYSFTLTFDRPYGFFLADLRSWIADSTMLLRPSKFLKDYHPKYTDVAKLNDMAKEVGLVDWKQHLQSKAANHWGRRRDVNTIGVPHFQAWFTTEISETDVRVERNAYYCWVDTLGQQLPYIDRMHAYNINELDAQLLKIMSGEIDVNQSDWMRLPTMPVLLEGAERGGYQVQLSGGFNSPPLLFINQDFDYETPASQWQKLVQDPDKRFGRAVALAIDKHDINDSLYFGKYRMDDLVTTADHDPDQANSLLDELGMTARDGNGFRTYPDGSSLEIQIMTHGASPDQIDVALLISQDLQDIGINATAKQVAPQIFHEKGRNNEYMMTVMWNDQPGHASGISEDYWPRGKGDWAPASGEYVNTGGKQGRQPPAYLQEFFDLHTARKAVPTMSSEGERLWAQLQQWFADNYVMVWPVGSITQPNIVGHDLKNLPGEGYPILFGLTESAPQWYFESP